MWAGVLHLVFGNALIGIGEGLLLVWLFSAPKGKSVLVMIAANYASAWLGGLFIRGAIVRALPMDLTNGWKWFWVMVVVTYCLTLVLEWPFVAWCFRGKQDWLGRSVRASLVVQTASYVLLFGWYWGASGTSLYTRMKIVPPSALSLPESVVVYFIAPADGNVYRRQLGGGVEQKVFDLHSTNEDDRLLVCPNATDTNSWDLVARLESDNQRGGLFVGVLTNTSVEGASEGGGNTLDPAEPYGTWPNFGKVLGFASATNSQWKFWTGFWPVEGLEATHISTGKRIRFAYETPFGAWTVRNAIQLPSDQVLFQLGDDQICAFDPAGRRVALLWRGRGLTAVIQKTITERGRPER
jgi:hypothetical protein